MSFIKRHTFLLLAILIISGGYLFLRSEKAIAPTKTSETTTNSEGNEGETLTDEALRAYVKSDFDKAAMMGKEVQLGKHRGTPVLATFPCSDVCPQSTVRIVRYEVSPDQCKNAGGELKSILVPIAITVRKQEFCFPKPVIEAGVYDFVDSSS